MLDAHQINVFLVAAETLNFTKAAERLHMSQPSVSQHIQSLEQHFKTGLFSRSRRSLILTDAGLALVPLARDFIKQSTLIEETMASLKGTVYGHLTVGCSTTPGKYVLPHLLASFHKLYPRVKVTCEVSSQIQALDMLCSGELHFALTSIGQERCQDAEFMEFLHDPIILLVPEGHPWVEIGEIEPDELLKETFIMRETGSGTFAAVDAALFSRGINIEQLNVLLTLGNSEAIALSVKEGLGIGFISRIIVDKLGYDGVVPIKIKGADIYRIIYIGRHTHRPPTTAQIAFWNFIQSTEFSTKGPFRNYLIKKKS
jgi:DNA-binding transcriptional LysR family regulator